MSRSLKIFCVLSVVVGVTVPVLFFILPHEPSYQGRRLSAWLGDFEAEAPERRETAAKALEHIGREAVPFLVERLKSPNPGRRDSPLTRFRRKVLDWVNATSRLKLIPNRPTNPRMQALAGLDALGPEAKDALPALEALVHEQPPDGRALYVVARIGSAGQPILLRAVTNEIKVVRVQARVCLEMMRLHSKELYPEQNSGAEFSDFYHRICQYHLKTLRASFEERRLQRGGVPMPNGPFDKPPASVPPELMQRLLTNWAKQDASRVTR